MWRQQKTDECRTHHGDVIAVEENLVQFGYSSPFWCDFTETETFPEWHKLGAPRAKMRRVLTILSRLLGPYLRRWVKNVMTTEQTGPGRCYRSDRNLFDCVRTSTGTWSRDPTFLTPTSVSNRSLNSVGRWKDTDEIIKSQQGADDLFVSFHDNVNSWTDTFVHQLCKEKTDRLEIL